MNKSDRHAISCGDKWRDFGKKFGWTLHGWNNDSYANYFHYGKMFTITKEVMASIEDVISNEKANP